MSPAEFSTGFPQAWDALKKKWIKTPSGYVNRRLENQRAHVIAFHEKQTEKANKRWSGNATAYATALPRQCHGNALRSPISRSKDLDPSALSRVSTSAEQRTALRHAAHTVLDHTLDATDGDLAEAIKTAAALKGYPYDAGTVTAIINAVRGTRARRTP